MKSRADLERELRPAWAKHTGKRIACDQCVRDLHETAGVGPLPRDARLVRTVKATGDVQRLCGPHGEPLREADQGARKRTRGRRR